MPGKSHNSTWARVRRVASPVLMVLMVRISVDVEGVPGIYLPITRRLHSWLVNMTRLVELREQNLLEERGLASPRVSQNANLEVASGDDRSRHKDPGHHAEGGTSPALTNVV